MGKHVIEGESTKDMLIALEADLRTSVDSIRDQIEPAIEEMVSYHLGWSEPQESGGKRIRPLLTLLCCQAAGGDWQSALPAATAVEWIHNFSLIHDDIQDRSEMRRGRPTVWMKWGQAQAINTGDAIFALSRLTTQRMLDQGLTAEKVLRVQKILDETSLALTRGQHLDISFEDKDQILPEEYLNMIACKTGALLGAACQIGAFISPAPKAKIELFKNFGRSLGLAFQVVDDLLGVWGSSETTGKSSADDLRTRKKTLPIIHGLRHSADFQNAWSVEHPTDDDIKGMRRLLEDAGSRDFTSEWAERYTNEAMSALKAAKPIEPAGSSLSKLAARLLQRVS
jgi:geranylgeranyl diphosphate synthase type I